MTKALIIKVFKVIWNNFLYKQAVEFVNNTENEYDNKFLEAMNTFLGGL